MVYNLNPNRNQKNNSKISDLKICSQNSLNFFHRILHLFCLFLGLCIIYKHCWRLLKLDLEEFCMNHGLLNIASSMEVEISGRIKQCWAILLHPFIHLSLEEHLFHISRTWIKQINFCIFIEVRFRMLQFLN